MSQTVRDETRLEVTICDFKLLNSSRERVKNAGPLPPTGCGPRQRYPTAIHPCKSKRRPSEENRRYVHPCPLPILAFQGLRQTGRLTSWGSGAMVGTGGWGTEPTRRSRAGSTLPREPHMLAATYIKPYRSMQVSRLVGTGEMEEWGVGKGRSSVPGRRMRHLAFRPHGASPHVQWSSRPRFRQCANHRRPEDSAKTARRCRSNAQDATPCLR